MIKQFTCKSIANVDSIDIGSKTSYYSPFFRVYDHKSSSVNSCDQKVNLSK